MSLFSDLPDRLAQVWEDSTLRAGEWWRWAAPMRSAASGQAERTGRHPLAWGSLYVALFCLLSILLIDRPLALFLKAHVHGDAEGFFRVVTELGRAEYYMVPAALLWLGATLMARRALDPIRRQRLREWAWRPAFLFLSIAGSGLVGTVVKHALGRARPRLLFEQGFYGFHPFSHDWALNSFPSGHSQTAWAAMAALVLLAPRYDLLWLMIAVLVAASRVALTVHFLGDVVAGSWLGFAGTLVMAGYLRQRGVRI